MARQPDVFRKSQGVASGTAGTTYAGSYRSTTASSALRLTGLTPETKAAVTYGGMGVLDTRDELLRVVRAALQRWAGPQAVNQLADALQAAVPLPSSSSQQSNGNAPSANASGGLVPRHEFEVIILQLTGEHMSRSQATALANAYMRPATTSVDYHSFIRDLAIGSSGRRLAIVRKVFDKLRNGHEYIAVATLLASYNARNHPDVLRGERKADAVYEEFRAAIHGAGVAAGGKIGAQGFEAYYGGISSSSPLTDDAFVSMMERLWSLKEVDVVPDPNQQWLLQVRSTIREKCRAKSTGRTAAVNELLSAFKFFDSNENGSVSFDEWTRALERIGLRLPAENSQWLFQRFDADRSGSLSYAEFSALMH